MNSQNNMLSLGGCVTVTKTEGTNFSLTKYELTRVIGHSVIRKSYFVSL